ncbi:MAG TPA: hypothetical protein VMC80_02470 [Patescibacteria group bacterium]|nr:hypothetical protein [Patescibacteria group bacterium]
MADPTEFKRAHHFQRELTCQEVSQVFDSLKRKLRNSQVDYYESPTGWPSAFIFRQYKDGMAYLFVSLTKREGHRDYCSMFCDAETPWEQRRNLTEKLDAEIVTALPETFQKVI